MSGLLSEIALSRQTHMNENFTFLPVSLADSSDRNHVQVDQELFSFLCQGHMMCFCQIRIWLLSDKIFQAKVA